MEPWEVLRNELTRLLAEQPGALQSSPTLDGLAGRRPPYCVRLSPWAEPAAERLHELLGRDVELVVGLLRYPGRELARARPDRVRGGVHYLTAVVVDPITGDVVSGSSGYAALTADRTRVVGPRSSELFETQVPTGSCVPALGYTVPPGDWMVRARLTLDGVDRNGLPIPLVVTP